MFINHLDVCFVNSDNLKFSVNLLLIFFCKHRHNTVVYFKVKIFCYFFRNGNAIIVSFFSNLWSFPGYKKFFERRLSKSFPTPLNMIPAKLCSSPHNSCNRCIFLCAFHIIELFQFWGHSDLLYPVQKYCKMSWSG